MLQDQALSLIRGLHPCWGALLERVAGLRLDAGDVAGELRRELPSIDRSCCGFDDFAASGTRAIEPGDPARSLLYHALASPNVQPCTDAGAYPTDEQLDLLENWIWSLAPIDPIPADAVIATFAYEYRIAQYTPHGRHADFVWSRTGIARVGEQDAARDAANRCWSPTDGGRFRVMPARYAAFLAVPGQAAGVAITAKPQAGDDARPFLLPLTKLFDGATHVAQRPVRVAFSEFHRAEKLR